MLFRDRADAGKQLASLLIQHKSKNCLVLALPRGGVALGVVVAKELGAPIDLVVVRKIGHPLNPEYAIGAISEDGRAVWNQSELAGLDTDWIKNQLALEQSEARRRQAVYRSGRPP